MHAHDWKPIPGWMARYRCACGVTGYRAGSGIRAHVNLPVQHHAEEQAIGSTAGKKPSLDDYDQARPR
jgi:hypothetical protein